MGEENKIRDAVDAATGLVKAVPVYEDVVQPAAKEIGAGLKTVAKTVHIALAPVSALVWGFEQIKEFVGTSVAKRLEKIPNEKIITPPAQIAGPALEALKYTGHEETLREMYGKLLATAMNADQVASAHPGFVEIIKQLSPDEARICKLFKDSDAFPTIDLNLKGEGKDDGSYKLILPHYALVGFDAGCVHPHFIQRYLDNLARLGIVEIPATGFVTISNKEAYKPLENAPQILQIKERFSKQGNKVEVAYGIVRRTPFGIAFIEACID
ncbi:MAG: DUF4393 domain-containing protein [Verrucomicrobiae bacterium]